MPRSIDSADGWFVTENPYERVPRPTGLRESVQQNEPRKSARADRFLGVEDRAARRPRARHVGHSEGDARRSMARRMTRSKVSLSCAPGIAHAPSITYVGTPVMPCPMA